MVSGRSKEGGQAIHRNADRALARTGRRYERIENGGGCVVEGWMLMMQMVRTGAAFLLDALSLSRNLLFYVFTDFVSAFRLTYAPPGSVLRT